MHRLTGLADWERISNSRSLIALPPSLGSDSGTACLVHPPSPSPPAPRPVPPDGHPRPFHMPPLAPYPPPPLGLTRGGWLGRDEHGVNLFFHLWLLCDGGAG